MAVYRLRVSAQRFETLAVDLWAIQSIPGEGVTDQYTDKQMYSRPEPRYRFTIYGHLQNVRY